MTGISSFFAQCLEIAKNLYPERKLPKHPVVIVHSGLSAFPQTETAHTVVNALMEACRTRKITVVMPVHGDRGLFGNGRCTAMGKISDCFRTMRGVRRSAHPVLSFCAKGPHARAILRKHRAEYGLGERSPLGRLFDLDAFVLMLGTNYDTCTVMHLAEYRNADSARAAGKTPDMVTCWHNRKQWEDISFHTERFQEIGEAFERTYPGNIFRGPMPGKENREWRLIRVRDIVLFSIDRCGYLE